MVNASGRVLAQCQYHHEECRKRAFARWRSKPYKPPSVLLSLSKFSHLDAATLAYAAGLIEGEGYIAPTIVAANSPRPYPQMKVKMTDREPIEWLHRTFGGRLNYVKACPPRKEAWVWMARGRLAGAVAAATSRYYKAERKRKAALLIVRVASLCGWWRGCSVDPRGLKIISSLIGAVHEWQRYSGYERRVNRAG